MSPILEQRIFPGRDVPGLLRWLPVMLGLAAMYVPTYVDLAQGLWKDEAHAHGPIILAVVAWLAWRRRAAFSAEAEKSAQLAGGMLLASGLLLYAVGRSQGIAVFEVGSHIPVLAGTVLLLLGWHALGRLWFPLFFLVFLIPLPGFVIYAITGLLKEIVSQAAEVILYGLGYPIARTGVVISLGQYELLVTDACAGLNSLYGLAALGFVYLHLVASGNAARAVCLIASIVPIALAANVVRVLILSLITFHLGEEAGQSFLHEFAGMTLFAIALALLLGLDALLRRPPRLRRSEAGT